ncbi:MAG: competence/damage-inducible protein A [Candidatus Melainabacteria bacterium]|nr:MAG: competence/damage-inducible protein A [Candidatus Melainabacteria bacterium]
MATAETLSIGTELLLGDVLDTNAQFLAIELAQLGINCFFRTTVGDNKERIHSILRAALNRADIVITTGGLGPTPDDLTTESIADFFGAEMVLDEAVLAHIQKLFAARNFAMPESNNKQALLPVGANWLPNPRGTAPGIVWKVSESDLRKAEIVDPSRPRTILTFPGVPSEMKAMWAETARPYLQANFVEGTLWSCELKHYGIGESALAEKYAHLLSNANPSVAPYAGLGECRLRVAAKAATIDDAKKIAAPVIEEITKNSGNLCYGTDKETLESVVGKYLTQREMTLSTAESCTGGYVSKRLTDVPGSSLYTTLNVVTYSNQAKHKILGVSESILKEYGAVSPQCAKAMALGVMKFSQADIGVSVTGIAGPDGGTDDKPVGLVYFGLAAKGFLACKEVRFSSKYSREEVRYRSASEALNMVRLYLIDPQSFENEHVGDVLRLNYFMKITRGIVPQFKGCELDVDKMPRDEAEKLRELVELSGILSVRNGFVERAGNLVSWKLIVESAAGTHTVASRAGDPEHDAEESELDLTELLDFLGAYLEEKMP